MAGATPARRRGTSAALALGVACLLAGCVGAPVVPPAARLAEVQRLQLVPMEAPPLQVDAAWAASGPASLAQFLPRYTVGMVRAVGVLGGVMLLLELPDLMQRPAVLTPEQLARVATVEGWQPAPDLAREAQRLLAAAGCTGSVADAVRPIPGLGDRGRTVLMENWMAPIRAWYNGEAPAAIPPAHVAEGYQAVLEIGISNYEVYAGRLLLQVHARLLDPRGGALLGRARASEFAALPSMDAAFADGARELRRSVLDVGGRLVLRCLEELGLVARR